MFGEVAGHAGLFSNADDLGAIMQMFLNGGSFNGKRYIKACTINFVQCIQSSISRRGMVLTSPKKIITLRKDSILIHQGLLRRLLSATRGIQALQSGQTRNMI